MIFNPPDALVSTRQQKKPRPQQLAISIYLQPPSGSPLFEKAFSRLSCLVSFNSGEIWQTKRDTIFCVWLFLVLQSRSPFEWDGGKAAGEKKRGPGIGQMSDGQCNHLRSVAVWI